MGAGKLEKFGGMLPAWSERLLPPGQAAFAQNCFLFSGELVGWRKPKKLRDLVNTAAQRVYRVPTITKTVASDTLTVISNPTAGDTVKVGEETYTFRAALASGGVAYEVLIGADANATTLNLYNALVGDDGLYTNRGVTYGKDTIANPAIDLSGALRTPPDGLPNTLANNVITLYAPDSGAAFNNTAVAESTGGVRMAWSSSTFTGGTNATFDSSITGAATWLEFNDPDTDVIRSPVVDDQFARTYFASPSKPPQYNTYDRIVAGQSPWLLGVPAPGCAPGISITGGGDLAQLGFPTSTSANASQPLANRVFLVPITPTGAMQLNDVAFMPATTDATGQFAAVLYDSDGTGGEPGSLVNTGTIIVGATAGTAVQSSFVNPSGLLANVKYWIGIATDSNVSVQFANDLGNAGNRIFVNTFSNGPPATAPAASADARDWQMWADLTTSSVIETRAYVYTWVSAYGEEGPPSPPSSATGWSNAIWHIDLFQPPPDDIGVLRNLTKKRLYRTVPDTNGQTQYFFVTELDITAATHDDAADDLTISLNSILQTLDWFPPPEGLIGIEAMPNGMFVGFKANELWFCEPYQPHAWPAKYTVTTEFPIVGIGVHGQSCIAATSGNPYIATGSAPSAISLEKTKVPEPCLSRGSVLSTEQGVFYASPNGLVRATQSGQVVNVTEMWITRDRWKELLPQKNLRAVLLQSTYFCFGIATNGDNSVAQKGFTIELSPADTNSFSIWPQAGGHRLGLMLMTAPDNLDIYGLNVDPYTGIAFIVQDQDVKYWDFADPAPALMTFKWRSPVFIQPSKKNFQAMRITFTVPPGAAAQSASRFEGDTDDPLWLSLQAGQYLIVRVYAGLGGNEPRSLVTAREVRTDSELLRILSGFKAFEWQIELEGVVQVANMQYATSVKELRSI